MKKYALLAVLAGVLVLGAGASYAGDSFAISVPGFSYSHHGKHSSYSVGVPGFSYSHYGKHNSYSFGFYGPSVYQAPPVYYAPAPAYCYPPPVVYHRSHYPRYYRSYPSRCW